MDRHDISQRRACRLVSVDPKTVRREPEPDNPEIRVRMRDIAGERRRFGYRRIGLMLEREGIEMNHKKLRLRIPMMTPTYSEQSTPMRSDNSTPTILRCAGGVDKSPARGLGQAG